MAPDREPESKKSRTPLLIVASIAFWALVIVLAALTLSGGPGEDAPASTSAPAPTSPRVSERPTASFADAGFAPVGVEDDSRNNALVGVNLAGCADWNTELPFVDEFKLSRKWISQKQGEKWGGGPALATDEHGWVTKLEDDCSAETPVLTFKGHKPAGEYVVLYRGDGDLTITRGATEVSREKGRIVYDVAGDAPGLFLKITRTAPDDYLRDIRVVLPGHEKTYETEPFRPGFLETWRPLNTFRFMDWMKTNNSEIENWEDRPEPTDATYTTRGVPLEVMIDLCNRQLVNPWFCMPHKATDAFVRSFASMVRDRLDPTLHVYVEYSNELWNGMFAQSKYAGERGTDLGFAEKPWEAGWRYTAYRSVQIFEIWEEVFGSRERLVRVLATQSSNPFVSKRILEFREAYRHADALAVAPYMAMNVRRDPEKKALLHADDVATWDVDRVLTYVEDVALAKSSRHMKAQAQVASDCGLRLIAYEGGQHLVGVGGGENNKTMTALFHEANRHPKMGALYAEYLETWRAAGGDLFCAFSSIGIWSKWGSWGLAEYWDESVDTSPKLAATLAWNDSTRLDNAAPEVDGLEDVTVRVGVPHTLSPVVTNDYNSRMALLAAWSSDDPARVTFEDAHSARTSVVVSRAGTYRITLRLSDGFARSSTTVGLVAE